MPGPTVLCIDDEEVGLAVRKILLERAGYTVLTATNGPAGLDLFDSRPVSIVVLDYTMPEMDGGVVASAMRKRKPSVPIVILSAHLSLPEDVRRVADASAVKGDGVTTLLATLRDLLGKP